MDSNETGSTDVITSDIFLMSENTVYCLRCAARVCAASAKFEDAKIHEGAPSASKKAVHLLCTPYSTIPLSEPTIFNSSARGLLEDVGFGKSWLWPLVSSRPRTKPLSALATGEMNVLFQKLRVDEGVVVLTRLQFVADVERFNACSALCIDSLKIWVRWRKRTMILTT